MIESTMSSKLEKVENNSKSSQLQDTTSLHDQLQRALSELKAYQVKYPPIFTNDPQPIDGNGPVWETASDVMSPLLRSYDARIYELESIATQQAIQLDKLRSQPPTGAPISDPSLEVLKEDLMHDLGERMEVLLAENALLSEQKRVLSEELDSFQHDLDECTQQLDQGTKLLLATEPKLAQLQNALQQTEQDRDSAATKAISYSEALGKTQARLEVALSELNGLRSHSIDLEKLYKQEQLDFHKYKFDMDRETLESMQLAQRAEDRSNELKMQLSSKAEDLESTQEILRKLRREYQSTRQDAEGMVKVIAGLERQVSEFTAAEERNKVMLKQWQERIDEALFLRDQAEGKAESLAAELSRLVEQRKQLALSRERDIATAIQEANKRALDQITALENDLKLQAERCGSYQAQHEISQREAKIAKSLLEKTQSTRDGERRASEQLTRDLEARLLSMTVEKSTESARCKDAEQRCTHYRTLVEGLRNEVEALKKQQQQQDSLRSADLLALKATNIDLQQSIQEKNHLVTQVEKELSQQKEKHKRDLINLERRMGDENEELRTHVSELREYSSQLERTLESGTAKRTQLLETVRNSSSVAVSQLEAELAEERDRFNALAKAKMEIELRLEAVLNDNKGLSLVVDEADRAVDQLEQQLADSRRIVSQVTQQLSDSFDARKRGTLSAAKRIAQMQVRSDESEEEIEDGDENQVFISNNKTSKGVRADNILRISRDDVRAFLQRYNAAGGSIEPVDA